MYISSISVTRSLKSNFKQNQDSILYSHIRNAMSENFDSMLEEAKNRAKKGIKDEFYDEFNKKIEDNSKSLSNPEIKSILVTLMDAYKKANLYTDSNAINHYIQEKNL